MEASTGPTAASLPSSELTLDGDPHATSADAAGQRVGGVLEPGAVLGRYRILEMIGAGGMGVVYAAYDTKLDRRVAIKLLHAGGPFRGDEGDGRGRTSTHTRLLREAQAMARLTDANVVTVHDVGEIGDEDVVYLAMEYIDGMTLRRWLRSQARDWRDVLAVLVAAGRGLHAAHRAGLVHRDFKPDNVMVSVDGRTKVMDFGIARSAPDTDAEGSGDAGERGAVSPGVERRATLDLTRTGAVMGTPAYMSPEQHEGRPADPRSDQFSFCVTAYEALFARHPHGGDNFATLACNILEGKLRPPPGDSPVPAPICAAILRGLATSPDDRYPDMESLLADLAPAERPVWRRPTTLAIGAALVVGAAAIAWGVGVGRPVADPAPTCRGAAAKLAGLWDDSARERTRARFAATELPYAVAAYEGVASRFDAYTGAWARMHEESCLATHRGEQSQQLLDLRMSCLDDKLRDFAAIAALMRDADADAVRNAVRSADSLAPLFACADTEALTAMIPPPSDPAQRARVAELRARLADVRSQDAAGRVDAALAAIEPLVAEAVAVDYRPLEADVLYDHGVLLAKVGRHDEAIDALERSTLAAEAGGHDRAIARASAYLVHEQGLVKADAEAGAKWALRAEAALERIGEDRDLRANLLAKQASLAYLGGELPRARTLIEESMRIHGELDGADSLAVASDSNNLGILLYGLAEYDASIAAFERSLAILRVQFGEDHPDVAVAYNNLGPLLHHQGRDEEAMHAYDRALTIWEAAFGAGHDNVAKALTNRGSLQGDLGRYEEAMASLERALAIREAERGESHPDTAVTLSNIGEVELARGHEDEAIAAFERALRIREQVHGGEGTPHPEIATAMLDLAGAYSARGRLEDALAQGKEAVAMREALFGGEHREVGDALFEVGKTLLALGRAGDARATLTRAWAIVQPTLAADARDADASELALLLAQTAGGSRENPADLDALIDRARSLADDAQRAKIDAWRQASAPARRPANRP